MTSYKTITDYIGNTPLVHLPRLSKEYGATILGKCEFMNPCASVKDRTAIAMINAAETSGELKAGTTILEATSGNTGVGLAFAAATKGYPLVYIRRVIVIGSYRCRYRCRSLDPGGVLSFLKTIIKKSILPLFSNTIDLLALGYSL